MSNMWRGAQLRQPGRSIYVDLAADTFDKFFRLFLSKKNFKMSNEAGGAEMSLPQWSHRLSYEYELRREALRFWWGEEHGYSNCLVRGI